MITHKQLEAYILGKSDTWLDYPFGEGVAVYKVGGHPSTGSGSQSATAKMFALIQEGKQPVRISLKCDPVLAEKLREEYESVLPGYHLNKKHWNTIVCSGQLSDQQLFDLIDLSYNLVSGS